MKQKVVLITGASSGIGLAACKKFHDNGWHVVGVARREMPENKFISRYVRADVSKSEDIQKICQSITSNEKRLDVLINNAACQICKPLIQMEVGEWDMVYAANVRAPFLLSKNLYKLLSDAKGTIVNVASIHAVATSSNIAAYASSKAALVGLTRNMAIEFAKDDIRVNAILPGAVDTPMLRDGLQRGHIKGNNSEDIVQKLGNKHIVGRVGNPQEIAELIYCFADKDKVSFLTGQTLIVDGGATIKLSTE